MSAKRKQIDGWAGELTAAVRRKDRLWALKIINEICPASTAHELAADKIISRLGEYQRTESVIALARSWVKFNSGSKEMFEQFMDVPISALGVSSRMANTMESNGVYWVGQLHGVTEADIREWREVGPEFMEDLRRALRQFLMEHIQNKPT